MTLKSIKKRCQKSIEKMMVKSPNIEPTWLPKASLRWPPYFGYLARTEAPDPPKIPPRAEPPTCPQDFGSIPDVLFHPADQTPALDPHHAQRVLENICAVSRKPAGSAAAAAARAHHSSLPCMVVAPPPLPPVPAASAAAAAASAATAPCPAALLLEVPHA